METFKDDDGTMQYLGVPIRDATPEVMRVFCDQAHAFTTRLMAAVEARFGSNHPVARAPVFLDFFRWPWWDPSALATFMHAEVQLTATHFENALPPPEKCG